LRGGHRETTRSRRRIRSESGTFSGHRAYSEGEDIRNLDWNVYARTDELFLKVLEDEDRIGLTLVMDHSRSMLADDRWTAAARLAAILGGLALVQNHGLHFVWGTGQGSILQGAAALGRFLEQLESLTPDARGPREDPDESDATNVVRELLEHPVGRLAWVSDFAQPKRCQVALAMLRKHGCRCRGWLPSLPTDRIPLADGFMCLEDPETGEQEVLQVDAGLQRAMMDELELLAKQQDAVFGTVGYGLSRFPVPETGDYRIASWSGDGAVYNS
jgi:uncharacterized protein (DUF58 family)